MKENQESAGSWKPREEGISRKKLATVSNAGEKQLKKRILLLSFTKMVVFDDLG